MEPESSCPPQEEAITPETVQQFNKVCVEATELMMSYKQQSEDLKKQISSMVNIYNKNADPSSAVPVDKLMQITNQYQKQMRSAQTQYHNLEEQLKKQEIQRNSMVEDIHICFQKLEKLQKRLKQKKQAQKQKQLQDSANQQKSQ